MLTPNAIDPGAYLGAVITINSLPYEAPRVVLDCGHSLLYVTQLEPDQPPFCGLCFFKHGFEAELPNRIHLSVRPRFATLAVNGNPETSPKFLSHLNVIMGLRKPPAGQALHIYRRARGHYSRPAERLFPVASALWKLMGYQPPLGVVLVQAVGGRTETEIAKNLDSSVMDIHYRMFKAINTALGYIPSASSA